MKFRKWLFTKILAICNLYLEDKDLVEDMSLKDVLLLRKYKARCLEELNKIVEM